MEYYILGEIGRVNDYSTIENGSFSVKVKLRKNQNPIDYLWDGEKLIYDKYVPLEQELNEIEQLKKENEELKQEQEAMKEWQDTANTAMLEIADAVFGGGMQND